MAQRDIPVLIVGGGTVGLSAAAFLAHHGVPTIIVERHAGLSIHPRAIGIGVRSMELLRAIGLEQEVRTAAAALPQTGGWISVETLARGDLGALARAQTPGEATAEPFDRFSPTTGLACAQDQLDPVLLDAARQHGAVVRFATELVAIRQDDAAVEATLVNRDSGERYTLRADYLIAADGSASRARDLLGIPTSGPGLMGHSLINVLFEADLSDLVQGHDFMLCEVRTPEAPGMFVRIRDNHRWVFHLAYYPAKGEKPEDFSPERCRERVRAAIGQPNRNVTILSILPWQVEAHIADRFQHGRVFLVGDAAHVVPPTGGFGMNTGIADAHNLAWKLALVLAGKADPALLATYDSERRPVAQFTMEQASLRLAHPQLHWDPTRVAEREQLGIANQMVVHLGYRYASEAIIGPRPTLPSLEHLDRDLDGSPSTRLPHLWVEWQGARVSTLDLIEGRFTLLAGPEGADWCMAAATVATRAGIEIAAYRIGANSDIVDPNDNWQSAAGIEDDGAVLVRPDGFIAWHATGHDEDPERTLARVVARQLGHWDRLEVATSGAGAIRD